MLTKTSDPNVARDIDNCITIGNARFTALSNHLVRMEFSPEGKFLDLPTVRTLNIPEAVAFSDVNTHGNKITLTHGCMTIQYHNDNQPFSPSNLSIDWSHQNHTGTWHPGDRDAANCGGSRDDLHFVDRGLIPDGVHDEPLGAEALGGRIPCLPKIHDHLSKQEERPIWLSSEYYKQFLDKLSPPDRKIWDDFEKFPAGPISRSGYFLLDESSFPRFDPAKQWLADVKTPVGYQDWYFFAYGHDYQAAMKNFVHLCGRVPMIPRWALGSWYSVFNEVDESYQKSIVQQYRDHDLPLDVLVLDLVWHTTPQQWEGYSWNKQLYPDEWKFIDWLHDQQLHVSMSLHPEAIIADDPAFDALRRDPGAPKKISNAVPWCVGESSDGTAITRDRYVFNLADKCEAKAHADHLLTPMIQNGCDVLWIDGDCDTNNQVDRQLWTNHVYYQHTTVVTDKRGMIFSRCSGIGSHRYPIGFSGDTWSHWEVLAHEIDMTARAGNSGVAYWSHDIGGFNGSAPWPCKPWDLTMRGFPTIDPELYVRWVQFGALSPIFRLHCHHAIREPWHYGPVALDAVRKILKLRMSLLPYIYHFTHETFETGVPFCRQMYLAYPECEEAYHNPHQFMIGDRILASPISQQGGCKTTWIPPGKWISMFDGSRIEGPQTVVTCNDIASFPLYVRAGSIIPCQTAVDRAGPCQQALMIHVYPGGSDRFELYEDDGESRGYADGVFARIPFVMKQQDTSVIVRMEPVCGACAGISERRSMSVIIHGVKSGCSVEVDGKAASATRDEIAGALLVNIGDVSIKKGWELVVGL